MSSKDNTEAITREVLNAKREEALKSLKEYAENESREEFSDINRTSEISPCLVSYLNSKKETIQAFAVDFTLKSNGRNGVVMPSKYFALKNIQKMEDLIENVKENIEIEIEENDVWIVGEGKTTWEPDKLIIKAFGEYQMISFEDVEIV